MVGSRGICASLPLSVLAAPGAVLFCSETGKGRQPKLSALAAVETGGATLPHLQQGRRLPVPSSNFHRIPLYAVYSFIIHYSTV